MFMQANLIVKRADGSIAGLYATSLDEASVRTRVRELEAAHPGCSIDLSQVEAARAAMRANFVDVGSITEYGLTQKLSRAIRVF